MSKEHLIKLRVWFESFINEKKDLERLINLLSTKELPLNVNIVFFHKEHKRNYYLTICLCINEGVLCFTSNEFLKFCTNNINALQVKQMNVYKPKVT